MHHITPIVINQTGRKRRGRGFSPSELKEAGLNSADAKKLGVRIDRKRKTAHEENIKTLKAYVEKVKSSSKSDFTAAAKKKPKN